MGEERVIEMILHLKNTKNNPLENNNFVCVSVLIFSRYVQTSINIKNLCFMHRLNQH